jgi:hypothetical protein
VASGRRQLPSQAVGEGAEEDVVPVARLSLSRDPGILGDEHGHYRLSAALLACLLPRGPGLD